MNIWEIYEKLIELNSYLENEQVENMWPLLDNIIDEVYTLACKSNEKEA